MKKFYYIPLCTFGARTSDKYVGTDDIFEAESNASGLVLTAREYQRLCEKEG